MKPPPSAQDINQERVEHRFAIQGLSDQEEISESLFHLSSAPPLQKHVKVQEIFLEVQHFVPTRFEDKMKYLMAIERNRQIFAEERKRAKEMLALGLASKELRKTILGTPVATPLTKKEEEERRLKEGKEAEEENRMFELYELHEDRKRYNQQFVDNYNSHKLYAAHDYAKQFIGKCSEKQMEVALRQNVVVLRALGKGLGKKGRRCSMSVEDARGTSYEVIEPKMLPQELQCLKKNIHPFSPTKKIKKRRRMRKRSTCRTTTLKQEEEEEEGVVGVIIPTTLGGGGAMSRRKQLERKKAKRILNAKRDVVEMKRRYALQSCARLPKLNEYSGWNR